jgi:dihydrolipoamide dehydrogenase
VIGGGIIGLEMATVYAALGTQVSVVELTQTLMPGCDRDLVRPLQNRIAESYAAIMLGTKVTQIEAASDGIRVSFEGEQAPDGPQVYDRVLVAVGRKPNGNSISADKAGIEIGERGFINVDRQMRTNVPHIFAIGDIVGQPMLAHKATHEGKVAAEVAAGMKTHFDARVVPSVAYTDPEVAWVGLTEEQAKADGIEYSKGSVPWAASGRSLALGRSEGMTRLLCDKRSGQLIGAGIVGTNAGDLMSEAALAIELGCDAEDISLTIHPHPTLSETLAFAAEVAEGTITDLYIPRR